MRTEALFHRYCATSTAISLALVAHTARVACALPQETLIQIGGQHPSCQLGFDLASVGDLDGDGIGDFAVAAPGQIVQGQRRGQVQVFSGGPAAQGEAVLILALDGPFATTFPFAPTSFALSIDSGHDVDGDGTFDIVVGAPGTGQVFLHSGSTGADLMATGVTLHAGASSGHGAVVRFLNADGDTFPDLLVTRDNDSLTQPGRWEVIDGAWLRSAGTAGTRTLHTGSGLVAHMTFGSRAAVIGDVDGDGADDFAIAGPGGDAAHPGGCVEVRSGATGALLRLLGPVSPVGHGGFGAALAAAGDLDGDGRAELLVGIPTYDQLPGTQDDRGAVEVVRGAWLAGVASSSRTFALHVGRAPGEQLGRTVLGADLNADGTFDVVAGFCPTAHTSGVRAISGRTHRDLWVKVADSRGLGRTPLVSVDDGRWLVAGDTLSDLQGPAFGAVELMRAHDGRGALGALGALCPCGHDSPTTGCPHALGLGGGHVFGAVLAVEAGSASLSSAGLELAVTGGLPGSPYQLWVGSPSPAIPFHHGLLGIAGGPLTPRRLAAGLLDLRGAAWIGPLDAGSVPAALAGTTLAYQALYRDAGCGLSAAVNATNSYSVELRH